MPEPLLTDLEREIIDDAGKLWNKITKAVAMDVTRAADLDELIAPIHLIQRYFMGQAACRAYPDAYRPLGDILRQGES